LAPADASQEPLENVRQTVRGFAKDAVIRSNLVFAGPKAGGHLIVGYHLVLKEDKSNFEDHLKFSEIISDLFGSRPPSGCGFRG